MAVALITGSTGLIGSAASYRFEALGYDVWGVDNDARSTFFGPEASTEQMRSSLERDLRNYRHFDLDVRDRADMEKLVADAGSDLTLVIHAAAQPSHDWSALEPLTDFAVNAVGTVNVLEAVRRHAPGAAFIFTSTNKVYGDTPNQLPFVEHEKRYDLSPEHEWFDGIPESMSIDRSTHSPFGVSKAAADLMVQEYGRYFGMRTGIFRGGCLTGPGHAGAELHGFLAYLMKCTVTGKPYTVHGYQGKQVRDNIHAADLVSAFEHFARRPKSAAVYNIGGGREVNCSMLEAIDLCEQVSGCELTWSYSDANRVGDHQWWIGDLSRFRSDYPEWALRFDIRGILVDIFEANAEKWSETAEA